MRTVTTEMIQLRHSHDLLLLLAGRDFSRRFSGSTLGVAWRFLQPVVLIGLLTVVFTTLLPAKTPGVSTYGGNALYLCSALLPWLAIEETCRASCQYFIDRAELVCQTAHARLLFVLAPVLVTSSVLGFSLLVLLGAAALFGHEAGWAMLLLPWLLGLLSLLLVGLALACASLHTVFRDTQPFIESLLPIAFWLTPIVYHVEMLPDGLRRSAAYNPVAHLLGCFRAVILENRCPSAPSVLVFVGLSVIALVGGLALYGRLAPRLADHL